VSSAFRAFEALLDRMRLPSPGAAAPASLEQVVAVQDFLSTALEGQDFPLACVERDLERSQRPGEGGTDLAPFYKHPQSCVQVALAYWPPGYAAGAHEHSDWTVTAVFHNRLEVTTYDWDIARAERRLAQRHVFPALRGRVGRIYQHGIHDPRNPTSDWSISLHVFAPEQRPKLEDDVGPIPGLSRTNAPAALDVEPAVAEILEAAYRQGVRRARVAALGAFTDGPRVAALLAAIGAPTALAQPLTRASVLARAWPAEAALDVRVQGEHAELTIGRLAPRPILRTQRIAEPALRFMAEQQEFALGDVPGGFALEDLRDLADHMLVWGALQVADRSQNASEVAR
jgi:hypothetical protein